MVRRKFFVFFVFVVSISLILYRCGKKEEEVGEEGQKDGYQKATTQQISSVELHEHDGLNYVEINSRVAYLISQNKYDDIRKEFCGDNGCSDELKTFSDKATVSLVVTFTNTMILFQRVDKALSIICAFAKNSVPQLCGGTIPIQRTAKISQKQTDIVDTLFDLLGLNREEITTLVTEITVATENYIKLEGSQKYFLSITVPFNVKAGNLVNVWFKSGTEIRWDHMNILGSVSHFILAVFNVVNSHDLVLDIGSILQNAGQLLKDLSVDPAGFIRRIPETLELDQTPNFLRFKQGGDDKWKGIPVNLSKALTWAGNGLEYMFGNPCKQEDSALVCYKDGKIRFNFDPQKENKFSGKKTTGEIDLPDGLTGEVAQAAIKIVVKVLRNGGEKFDCSKTDNELHISEGLDKFDISDVINAVSSFSSGNITNIQPPDFMKIDVCKFFGAEGTQPKPIRDLLFPHELVTDGKDYKTADAGKFFAVEVEVSKNFYLKAITLGNNQDFPIYLPNIARYGILYLVTNPPVVSSDPSLSKLPYSLPAIASFVEGLSLITVPGYQVTVSVGNYSVSTYVVNLTSYYGGLSIESKYADFENFAPLLNPDKYDSGLVSNTIGLLVPQVWVKGDYVARGDGERFKKVKDASGNSLSIKKDYLEPLTSFISFRWYSKYPEDFVSSLTTIGNDVGKKFLIYVLLRDPSWNSSVQIDMCSILYDFANSASKKYEATQDEVKKRMIENILRTVLLLQNERSGLWECSVISGDLTVISHSSPKWKPSNNQIINDLLGLILFSFATTSIQ